MKRTVLFSLIFFLFAYFFISCNSSTGDKQFISADSSSINSGAIAFNKNCSGCHNFKQNNIGPQLSGITKEVPVEWLQNFIKDPSALIKSHDLRAQALYQQYKTVMPAFSLKNDALNNIIAFLNTHNERKINDTTTGIKDPIPEKIKLSNLVVKLQLVTQIPASSDGNKKPLARITQLDYQPGTGKIFIIDLRGELYTLENNHAIVYMDIAKLKCNFINEPGLATGFGSFAFHPQFAKNGLFYTTHTEKANSAKADFSYDDSIPVALQWVLTEWKADDPNAKTFKGTSRELLRVNMVSGIHGVQEISFNPLAKPGDEDYGLLYIGIGDGGCTENGYAFLAHNQQKPWGTILRIDPLGNNSANKKYGIPPTNPFVKNKNDLGEIYAYGFRNPHRFTWTHANEMLACNIGHGNIESIDLIKKGNDYGWPIREGKFSLNPYGDLNKVHSLPQNDSNYHITYPVAEYDHDEGKAICGGYEYNGNAVPQLKGKFLFGDIPTGRLFYIDLKDMHQGSEATIKEWQVSFNDSIKKLSELCGSGRVDLHFGKDAHGELYMLTKADGKVYKISDAVSK
jgi:glucose/arabinose dehydrogenase/mono/diheme cytochrome c family protein